MSYVKIGYNIRDMQLHTVFISYDNIGDIGICFVVGKYKANLTTLYKVHDCSAIVFSMVTLLDILSNCVARACEAERIYIYIVS